MALFKNVLEFRNTKMLQNSIRIMPFFENVGNTKMTKKAIMPLKMSKITTEELYPFLKMLRKNTKMILNSNKAMPDFENVRNTKLTIITYGVIPLKC